MLTIYLCGFMGCGKTTVGKALAERLRMTNSNSFNFTDLDEYIVRREGRSIKNIFDIDGEEYFRSLEVKSILELSSTGGVIALGGGTILNPDAAKAAKACGTIIYLDVPFESCYERVMEQDEGASRPLFSKCSKIELEDLFATRVAEYVSNSTTSVYADSPVEKVVQRIIDIIE